MTEIYGGVGAPPGSANSFATIEKTLLADYVNYSLSISLKWFRRQRSLIMRELRFTIPAILFAVFIAGCIVQADTYNDQNPFSAPDT